MKDKGSSVQLKDGHENLLKAGSKCTTYAPESKTKVPVTGHSGKGSKGPRLG